MEYNENEIVVTTKQYITLTVERRHDTVILGIDNRRITIQMDEFQAFDLASRLELVSSLIAEDRAERAKQAAINSGEGWLIGQAGTNERLGPPNKKYRGN